MPKWARCSVSLDGLLPVLYLKGISTGDFREALSAIIGPDARNLSCPSLYLHPICIRADGVCLQARMAENAGSIPVIIGATVEGGKELIGFQVGLRESAQNWHGFLTDIKGRGLSGAPEIAVADGAMGFWNALDKAFPGTGHQRCRVHQVTNVLNCFPGQMASAVKSDPDDIQHAGTRKEADAALAVFAGKYGVKYPKAVACLTRDRDAMLVFFGFPAEHWGHSRASNPIESLFATVRHRTVRTKGALS